MAIKLLIQIPCYNEEKTIALVLSNLPTEIVGVSQLDVQIVNDASTDTTIESLKDFDIKHIVNIPGPNKRYLGRAFQAGMKNALSEGYDILVNIDADNQYPADRISDLIKPILLNEADISIADRSPHKIKYFSRQKRFFQKLANLIISFFCMQNVPDAVSGFRAFSKDAMEKLILKEKYTYTVESLMQAIAKGLRISWVQVEVNAATRKSKLFSNIYIKLFRSGNAALRFYLKYFFWKHCVLFIVIALLIKIIVN